MVFRSTAAQGEQLFVADLLAPAAPPTQLTHVSRSIGSYVVSTDRTQAIFAYDAEGRNQARLYAVALTGGEPRELMSDDSISALKHVERARAPLFVYHGQLDLQVPFGQSEAIVAAWRGRGLPVEFMQGIEEGHGGSRVDTEVEIWTRALGLLQSLPTPADRPEARPLR